MKEPKSGVLLGSNELTLEDHVDRITKIRIQIKTSVLEMANAIKDAKDQLQDDTFTELSIRLNMGRSTLYQWVDIANSKFLSKHQDLIPDTFTALYKLALIEKKVIDQKKNGADKYLQHYVKNRTIHSQMSIADVGTLHKTIDDDFNALKGNQQKAITGYSSPKRSQVKSINEWIAAKKVFKTFVIQPQEPHLKKFSQLGFTQSDIRADLPIDRLLDQTIDAPVLGIVIVPNRYLPVGLKMLQAWGFKYADIYPLVSKTQNLVCWRGRAKPIQLTNDISKNAVIAEQVGGKPCIGIWTSNLNVPSNWSLAY